ncbi:MAG: hypothetical protein KGJ90_07090 [Patescibacteria group bacterium]|nr:hypothetical protein [Patescibacteria group bacterium]
MGIEAGKFFVSLGLTGAEKTVSGLAQVNDHFAGLKGISTEAKLAILAALAGLEQMVSMTGKFGNETMKTHQHLLVSIHDLQLYEAMAHNAGAATGSMTSAFENIQQTFQAMALEGKVPQFMPTLMALIQQGGYHMSADDIKKWGTTMGGPVQFFELLRNMALNSKVDKSKLNYMIQQSGLLPQDIYDVNRMGAFNQSNRAIAEKQIVSKQDVKDLNALNVEWERTIGMMEKFAKLFGTELLPPVRTLYELSSKAVDLLEKYKKENDKDRYLYTDQHIGHVLLGKDYDRLMNTKLPGGVKSFEFLLNINTDDKNAANAAAKGAVNGLKKAGYNVTNGKFSSTKVGQ